MDLAFIAPTHIRIIHDASLLQTLIAYREALSILRDHNHPTGLALKAQFTQAVEHIEHELRSRARRIRA